MDICNSEKVSNKLYTYIFNSECYSELKRLTTPDFF